MYCNLVTENNHRLGVWQFFKKIFFLLNLSIAERVRVGLELSMSSNIFLFALNTKNVVPSLKKERKLQPVHDNSEKTMNGSE